MDIHAPLTTKSIQLKPSKPWVDGEIKDNLNQQRKLELKWRKSKSITDHKLFQNQRSLTSKLIKEMKTCHISEKVSERQGNKFC